MWSSASIEEFSLDFIWGGKIGNPCHGVIFTSSGFAIGMFWHLPKTLTVSTNYGICQRVRFRA